MSMMVKKILHSIELLSEIEKQELVCEIIRRTAHLNLPPLTDEDLILQTEELLLDLDKQEQTDA